MMSTTAPASTPVVVASTSSARGPPHPPKTSLPPFSPSATDAQLRDPNESQPWIAANARRRVQFETENPPNASECQ